MLKNLKTIRNFSFSVDKWRSAKNIKYFILRIHVVNELFERNVFSTLVSQGDIQDAIQITISNLSDRLAGSLKLN